MMNSKVRRENFHPNSIHWRASLTNLKPAPAKLPLSDVGAITAVHLPGCDFLVPSMAHISDDHAISARILHARLHIVHRIS